MKDIICKLNHFVCLSVAMEAVSVVTSLIKTKQISPLGDVSSFLMFLSELTSDLFCIDITPPVL